MAKQRLIDNLKVGVELDLDQTTVRGLGLDALPYEVAGGATPSAPVSIATAVTDHPERKTFVLAPGFYSGGTISRSDITILSSIPHQAKLTSRLIINGNDCLLDGLQYDRDFCPETGIEVQQGQRCTVRNMYLTRVGSVSGGFGIWFKNDSQVQDGQHLVSNCLIEDCGASGLTDFNPIIVGESSGAPRQDYKYVRIDKCTFNKGTGGMSFIQLFNGAHVSRCTFHDHSWICIQNKSPYTLG